jgi:AcrR family transcriptional regulator
MTDVGDGVKRRAYDAAGRRAASRATRQRIVDAARALFLERGYRKTTIAAIAEAAAVNADTVYALVGRKPVLLRELIEQALSGTDHAVPATEREAIQASREAADPGTKLELYARSVRGVHGRLAPLFLAVRDAASTEPEAAAVWQEISDRRASNMRRMVAELRDAAGDRFRHELSIEDAADTVWATNSPELYVMLTRERGWTPDRYERWLAATWKRLLLER